MMLAMLAATALAGDSPLSVDATVHVLDNGLTVVLEEDHRTDQVALHLHYGVGARDERDGERGCAHLFEHVMFEGSRNVPGSGFDDWLTAAGGWNNAFTSSDETAYYMVLPSGALDLALFLESDRMGFLLDGLTQDNLDNQQLVVLQERAQGYAEPHGRDYDALTRLQFPAPHPYHTPVIGTVADVEGFQLEAVRDFWVRHYRPQNAVLGLVGNFDSDDALAKVEHWFSDIEDPGPPDERAREASVVATPRDGLIEDNVEDRTLYLSWQTVPLAHPDEAALDLLGWVLSGGRGTRLDDRLYYGSRLATDNGAFQWSSEIDGQFVTYASTDKASVVRVGKVMEKELKKLRRKPPTEAELDRARRALKSRVLDNLEQPADRAEVLVDCQRWHGRPDCLEADWERYLAVTPDDLARVAATYLTPERRITLSVVPPEDRGGIPGATAVELP